MKGKHMAKVINFKTLTEAEQKVLVKGIPTLNNGGQEWWDNNEFIELYKEWLGVTGGRFREGGFEQLRLAIAMYRKHIPLTYKQEQNKPHNAAQDLLTKAQQVRQTMVGAAYD